MAADRPPHDYVPPGPLETAPGGGYRDPEERRKALAAVLEGVETGAYDWRILNWLVGLDDTTCQTVASLLWRERLAGRAEAFPEGTVTKWAVRFSDAANEHTQPYYDEDTAREAAAQVRALDDGVSADVVSRQVGPWTDVAPSQEENC